ncbi:DUF3046 domain-containing protein [Propioniciclava coleopterorum]|uniref:DUF3046 domain-containing protein n=1 Tax=Propioniciclava coleopterorum TaxID=2714937 RepID=A0A6G7Y9C8_9ACTN|nr:DUF3046 domain-containing protein [Propioniciclava coleopterorum]QIK73380.1 DUF3046 domain-containing protein [Propioniciclava coleopterorum]
MREQELWRRIRAHVGAAHADTWARDVVLMDLGDRTVLEALDAGVGAQRVWRAVWSFLDLPESER